MESQKSEEELFTQISGDPVYHDSTDQLYDNNHQAHDSALNTSKDSGMSETAVDPAELERQREEWTAELAKLEEEITTLRSVLGNKAKDANELKLKLGITPLKELKQDLSHGIHKLQESNAYQKTNQAFKTAGEKTSQAVSAVGKKMSDLRNSQTFKSIEDKVGHAYSNVKRSQSLGSFLWGKRITDAKVTGNKTETDETLGDVMDKEGQSNSVEQKKSESA